MTATARHNPARKSSAVLSQRGGDGSPVFQSAEGALDQVARLVSGRIERRLESEFAAAAIAVKVDKMYRHLKRILPGPGFGRPMTLITSAPRSEFWVGVVMKSAAG